MSDQYCRDYREIAQVGEGHYGQDHAGVALLVEAVADKRKLVAKKIQLGFLKEKERTTVLAEVRNMQAQLLRSLKHFNIVSYVASFLSGQELVILMEYCEGGDLAHQISLSQAKGELIPETTVLSWLAQLCLALNYLHGKNILHRDIKPSNVYLTGDNTLKLGDFGIAKVLENSSDLAASLAGTPTYMSPEIVENRPYSKKSDVWALGCLIYEVCSGQPAFKARNLISLMSAIVNEEAKPIPAEYSPSLARLVK